MEVRYLFLWNLWDHNFFNVGQSAVFRPLIALKFYTIAPKKLKCASKCNCLNFSHFGWVTRAPYRIGISGLGGVVFMILNIVNSTALQVYWSGQIVGKVFIYIYNTLAVEIKCCLVHNQHFPLVTNLNAQWRELRSQSYILTGHWLMCKLVLYINGVCMAKICQAILPFSTKKKSCKNYICKIFYLRSAIPVWDLVQRDPF